MHAPGKPSMVRDRNPAGWEVALNANKEDSYLGGMMWRKNVHVDVTPSSLLPFPLSSVHTHPPLLPPSLPPPLSRELAIQIAEQCEALGTGIGVKCAVVSEGKGRGKGEGGWVGKGMSMCLCG